MVLLDELLTARTAESGVASVEAMTNSSSLPPALGPYFFTAALKPRDAVHAQHRIGAFERRRDADLDLLLSESGARHKQACQRGKTQTALQHRTPPIRVFVDVRCAENRTG